MNYLPYLPLSTILLINHQDWFALIFSCPVHLSTSAQLISIHDLVHPWTSGYKHNDASDGPDLVTWFPPSLHHITPHCMLLPLSGFQMVLSNYSHVDTRSWQEVRRQREMAMDGATGWRVRQRWKGVRLSVRHEYKTYLEAGYKSPLALINESMS